MLAILLKNLLEKIPSKTIYDEILKGVGYKNNSLTLFIKEQNASLEHLVILDNADLTEDALEKAIRAFLLNRWIIISETNSAYAPFPHSLMNQMCIQLAQAIVKPDEPLIQVLMPTVTVDDYLLASSGIAESDLISLTEVFVEGKRELAFWKFIISDDQRAIIPLEAWFYTQAQSHGEYFNHLYISGSPNPREQNVPLTDNEISRLKRCALPSSEAFFDEFDFRKKLINAEGTLAKALSKLCDGLVANGEKHKGSFFEAHDDVFMDIREFGLVLEKLTDAQRASIFAVKEFVDSWRIISGHDWHHRSWNNTETCVESHASHLRSALRKYPDKFSAIIINPSIYKSNDPNKMTPFISLLDNVKTIMIRRQTDLQTFFKNNQPRPGQDAMQLTYTCLTKQEEWLSLYRYFLTLGEGGCSSFLSLFYTFKNVEPNQFLIKAVESENHKTVDLLFKAGCSTWLNNSENKKAIDLIRDCKNQEALLLVFLQNGVAAHKIEVDGLTPLLVYAITHSFNQVINFILDPHHVQTEAIVSALHDSARLGWTMSLSELLNRGVPVDLENEQGMTALHCAAQKGKNATILLLITSGANIHKKDKNGRTALHHAVFSEINTEIQPLLDAGLAPDLEDANGSTALQLALERSAFKQAFVLLQSSPYTQEKLVQHINKVCPAQLDNFLSNYCDHHDMLTPFTTWAFLVAGGYNKKIDFQGIKEAGFKFTLPQMLIHAHVDQIRAEFGFKEFCEMTQIKLESLEGLQLYSACVATRLSSNRELALKALIKEGDIQKIWKGLQSERYWISRFWARFEVLHDMPRELKIFAHTGSLNQMERIYQIV